MPGKTSKRSLQILNYASLDTCPQGCVCFLLNCLLGVDNVQLMGVLEFVQWVWKTKIDGKLLIPTVVSDFYGYRLLNFKFQMVFLF